MRNFQRMAVVAVAGLAMMIVATTHAQEKQWRAYFGTYTGGKSEGIYVAEFDPIKGEFSKPRLAAKIDQPSFLAIAPSGKAIYTVNETSEFKDEKNSGGVSSFTIEDDGSLKFLNAKPSLGAAPCHIVLDKAGEHALIANYTGGNGVVYEVTKTGELGAKTAEYTHIEKGADGKKKNSHAHSINLDASNKFAFVADLGLDKIMIYKYDPKAGSLTANDPAFAETPKGGGPRHFSFHPNGKLAFVCNETSSSLTSFAYDAAKGTLTQVQTLSTLPEKTDGNSTAEVVVHPSGNFVYVSNRGHNSIAIFKVDPSSGKITAVGHQGKNIKVPRNFAVDPSGRWMIVCNQESNSVLVFAIDAATGELKPTESRIEVGNPVCVRFTNY